jgi:hypothetical protein
MESSCLLLCIDRGSGKGSGCGRRPGGVQFDMKLDGQVWVERVAAQRTGGTRQVMEATRWTKRNEGAGKSQS